MKRDRKISKTELKLLVKELRSIAKECGFTILINKRPIKLKDFYCGVAGTCNIYSKKLIINIYGRPANREILFTIAHEVRHAIHIRDGLYKSYYMQPTNKDFIKTYEGLSQVKLNLGVATRAERDCNHWADKWLASKNIGQYNELYSFFNTAHANLLMLKCLEERKIKNSLVCLVAKLLRTHI